MLAFHVRDFLNHYCFHYYLIVVSLESAATAKVLAARGRYNTALRVFSPDGAGAEKWGNRLRYLDI
jgi:hypothetical protein